MHEPIAALYYVLSLALGRVLRAGRYASVQVVDHAGETRVRKRRLFYAPFLVWLGRPLVRILNTGSRVLSQREWEQREQLLYRELYGVTVRVEADGTLVLPYLPGITLARLLDRPALGAPDRARAIDLAVTALSELHARGFTHGDAMAENVMVDLEAGFGRWFDFETLHDADRPLAWRRADDVRALLATTLSRTPPDQLDGTLERIVSGYGPDAEVFAALIRAFASVWQRALPFHLGQAPLSISQFREIDARLSEPASQ